MATIVLPYTKESKLEGPELAERVARVMEEMPPPLRDVAERHEFIREYLAQLPPSKLGLPTYVPELNRNMGDEKRPNYLYPTLRDNIFVHILAQPKEKRHSYIPLEPTMGESFSDLTLRVEYKLMELRDQLLPLPGKKEDDERQVLRYIDQVTTVDGADKISFFEKQFGFLRRGGVKVTRIPVTIREQEALRYLFIRDKVGLGALEPFASDPYIEDISCSGTGHIFIEHKIFKGLRSMVVFPDTKDLDNFVMWLGERIRKPVTFRKPVVDATLPDGSRINIVFGTDVSRRGSNFTIRKFAGTPISIFQLVEFGTCTYQMLAYLSLTIGNGMNVFVSGETASGKTTLLNAVTAFIHPMAKIISIEDTPELQVPHSNWIREVVQGTKTDGDSSGIDMFDLLKAALRQRPDEIIIGEIRGAEGNVAFQAMQTGHSVMATFHAASTEKLIQRLTGSPINVPKSYIDNLNIVILTSQVKLPDGKLGRRITGINEIINYDPGYDAFTYIETFHWNETNDEHEFTGYMSSYVLENLVAPRVGIPSRKKQRIYSELDRRAKILKKLHLDQGVTDFYEVLKVLSKAQRQGLF